jgi:hypothetical protein
MFGRFVRLELIPHYCRLIATLDKCLPDVRELLLEAVERDFRYVAE